MGTPKIADFMWALPTPARGHCPLYPIFSSHASPLHLPTLSLTFPPFPAILPARMENQTTNIDLSALDTEAMRSRLSELGSYL